ncbi:hypothetical protein MLD38_029361 [Melastoma candidum]|uniref:Uncharacterized protein n=1 Tax=Melastoma candidum TaxID=119954 RepID=A0ACB9N4D4_9MYRT|nr:hypothetical protein MLD38_029361 [Melastoma candidum]
MTNAAAVEEEETEGAEEAVGEEDCPFGKLPDHLLIDIFIRLPVSDWVHVSCSRKHWASLFRLDFLWQAALLQSYPSTSLRKRWPGPIPRGLSRRRYMALSISRNSFPLQGDMDEIIGHAFLFLKEQLELLSMTPPSGIIHGTMIDQFIACGNSREMAHELASQIWIAVLDNLEENEHAFLLLKRLAQEPDVFLPYPYSRLAKVQWRVFEKLLTDFRDCLNWADYYDVLARAKSKFQLIPSTWLGY